MIIEAVVEKTVLKGLPDVKNIFPIEVPLFPDDGSPNTVLSTSVSESSLETVVSIDLTKLYFYGLYLDDIRLSFEIIAEYFKIEFDYRLYQEFTVLKDENISYSELLL